MSRWVGLCNVYCVSCRVSAAQCPFGMRQLGEFWYCYGCWARHEDWLERQKITRGATAETERGTAK